MSFTKLANGDGEDVLLRFKRLLIFSKNFSLTIFRMDDDNDDNEGGEWIDVYYYVVSKN